MLNNPRNLTGAFNSDFFAGVIRCRKQDLDPNVRSDRWTSAAQYEGAVQRDIAGKPALRMFRPVAPVEDDWKPQLVSNRGPVLHRHLEGEAHCDGPRVISPRAVSQGAGSVKSV